ncbi:MAG: ribonuclease J [Alphaproteobacteria bacterium]|jgi:ribonuclease J
MKNSPTEKDLWFLPLGGTGEIGMNVNLYGHNKKWLMIDCGVTFNVPLDREQDDTIGVMRHNMVTADISFIANRRDSLCGIVLTHAHEDHLGAVISQWEQLQCPIYTTAFTAAVLRRKAYRADLPYELPIVVVETGSVLDIGPFTVEWIPTTHSIPEANALLITTAVARVLHTGDWKIDASPVIGEGFNKRLFMELASKNITAMVCDSTNANRPGHSFSEKDCEQGLGTLISKAKGRVVVTCFASNVARLITLAKIAQATNRYMCLLGPALENMVSIARSTGFWPEEFKITPRRHIGYLPRHEVLIVATGSQGEPRAGLYKLALNNHKDCDLEKDDTVIFSSIVIPGNEKSVKRLTHLLTEREINVVESANCEHIIHASGHPNEGDLIQLFGWVRPKCIVPVHGEPKHLLACSEVAKTQGINQQLVGLNGDLYTLAPRFSIKRKAISAPRIAL